MKKIAIVILILLIKTTCFSQPVYHIVAGSFKDIHNAKNRLSELKGMGFKDSKIISTDDDYKRICIAVCLKEEDVENFFIKNKHLIGKIEHWVYIGKLAPKENEKGRKQTN